MGVVLTQREQIARLQQENERLRNEAGSLAEIVAGLEYQACLAELGLTDEEMSELAGEEDGDDGTGILDPV